MLSIFALISNFFSGFTLSERVLKSETGESASIIALYILKALINSYGNTMLI